MPFKSWAQVFDYLSHYFKTHAAKKTIIFDEFQWMAAGQSKNLFSEQIKKKWTPWTGIAFENFCYNNLNQIAKALDIDGKIENFGPHIDQKISGVQIDLISVNGITAELKSTEYFDHVVSAEDFFSRFF